MKNIHAIRRIVATMANRLKKMGLTLSAAFKKAWELIKGKAIESKVAGVTKGNRQKALARIAAAYRPNQVKVWLYELWCGDNIAISINKKALYKLPTHTRQVHLPTKEEIHTIYHTSKL